MKKKDQNLRSILLLGPQGSGKTATFILLRQRLLLTAVETRFSSFGNDQRDYSAVYTLENRRIYVCSMGDYRNMIEQSILHAREYGCDTAIFAYNTQFSQTYMRLVPGASITLRKRITTTSVDEIIANTQDVDDLMWLSEVS